MTVKKSGNNLSECFVILDEDHFKHINNQTIFQLLELFTFTCLITYTLPSYTKNCPSFVFIYSKIKRESLIFHLCNKLNFMIGKLQLSKLDIVT